VSAWSALWLVAQAAEPRPAEAHVTVHPQVVVDLVYDREGEDFVESITRVGARAQGPARDGGRWFLSVQADYSVLVGLEDDGGDTEAATAVFVGESGWSGSVGPVYVRAGHLIERWGVMDLLPSTDVLNGQDLRMGPLTPIDALRVPAPMITVGAGQDKLRATAVWLPFGAASRVPLWGTDWSVLRQGMVEGLLSDTQAWSGDPLTLPLYQNIAGSVADQVVALDAQSRRGLEGAMGQVGAPRPLWEAMEGGLQLKARLGPVDLEAQGAWIRSRTSAPQTDAAVVDILQSATWPDILDKEAMTTLLQTPAVQSSRPRTAVAGGAVSALLGTFGVRAEGAHTTRLPVATHWLGMALSPMSSAGLAVDRGWGTRASAVVEGRIKHLHDPPENTLLVGTPNHIEVATAVRGSVARDRVSVEAGAIYDVTFAELAARPAARFRASDTVDLGIGLIWLHSDRPAAQTWTDAMTYTGGPSGYFGDNDAVWLDARWMR